MPPSEETDDQEPRPTEESATAEQGKATAEGESGSTCATVAAGQPRQSESGTSKRRREAATKRTQDARAERGSSSAAGETHCESRACDVANQAGDNSCQYELCLVSLHGLGTCPSPQRPRVEAKVDPEEVLSEGPFEARWFSRHFVSSKRCHDETRKRKSPNNVVILEAPKTWVYHSNQNVTDRLKHIGDILRCRSCLPLPTSNSCDFWIGHFAKFTDKGLCVSIVTCLPCPPSESMTNKSSGFFGCR